MNSSAKMHLDEHSERSLARSCSCLYVASPIPTYDTIRYDRMLSLIRHALPTTDVLPARGCFADTATWLREWPAILQRIDGLIFFDDGQGVVGRGVYHEVCTTMAAGKPTVYLSNDGLFWRYPLDVVFDLLLFSNQTWARVMHQTAKEWREL